VKKLILLTLMLVLASAAAFAECSYCLDACESAFNDCYASCQEYGPPAPSCTAACREAYQRCFDNWWDPFGREPV
jgi:hypothetical protein